MIVLAIVLAILSGYVGLLLSYHSGAAAGPAIILIAGILYVASVILGPVGGLKRHFLPARHLEA
jgi:zinc/manganese transport system permease protein